MIMRTVFLLTAGMLFLGFWSPVNAATLEEELAALLLDHPNIRAADKTVEAQQ